MSDGDGRITAYRTFSFTTPLAGAETIAVAVPTDETGQKIAGQLAACLRKYNPNVCLYDNPPGKLLLENKGPVFVIGNLAASRCVEQLYYQFRCATDRWYPGPGGWELRVLLNPYGTGYNVIHLGYSDGCGLERGFEELQRQLAEADPLPFLNKVVATRLPLSPKEVDIIRTTPLSEMAWRNYSTYLVDQKGYLGYLTNDQSLLAEYLAAWPGMIACGVERTPLIAPHLYMTSRLLVWRLLEQIGLISEELRLPILQFFYDWANSKEGEAHLQIRHYQSPNYPRQNHGLIPALALLYFADFMACYYPEITESASWQRTAQAVFAPYTTSWKPICDGLCHGWWLSQPVMLAYGLFDPEHRYFAAGGARRAAECALAVVNNEGWMPSAGDADLLRQFPGPSLRIAAAYYREPKYLTIYNRTPDERRFKWNGATPPPRAFAVDLPLPEVATPPSDQPITVIPMDPLVYYAWEKEPTIAKGAADTPPQAAIEECFDKLAMRAGWQPGDDYLLVDGLGGGSHSYADAGAILEYTRMGVSAIVSEDSLIWTAPEDHSSVFIVRDGQLGDVPAFAQLEEHRVSPDGQGYAYARLRLANYSGTDWRRELFFLPGIGLVCHDSVTADKEGTYSIEANFRTPAVMSGSGRLLTCRRRSNVLGGDGVSGGGGVSSDDVEVRLESLSPQGWQTERVPVEIRLEHPSDVPDASISAQAWCDRYNTDRAELMIARSRWTGCLKPGESVTLTTFIQIRKLDEPAFSLSGASNELRLSGAGTEIVLPCYAAVAPVPAGPETVAMSATGTSLSPGPRPKQLAMKLVDQDGITCLRSSRDGYIASGGKHGKIHLFSPQGDIVWQRQLPGVIYDIGFADIKEGIIAVGHAPAQLTALDFTGAILWTQKIVREPSPYPWWELPQPAPVQVVGGQDGSGWIMVGCGDMQVRCYEVDGTLRWIWRYNEGVPGRMLAGDVNGDGATEVLVGGEILSDTSCCRIITPEREVLAQLVVEGWTSCLTAVSWTEIPGSGRRLVACGASRGRNLRLYDITNMGSEMGKGQIKSCIEARYGGKVTALCFLRDDEGLVVGTSQGFVRCLDFAGNCRWQQLMAHGVVWLGLLGETIVLSDRRGGISLLTKDGRFCGGAQTDGAWPAALISQDTLWFTTGNAVGTFGVCG